MLKLVFQYKVNLDGVTNFILHLRSYFNSLPEDTRDFRLTDYDGGVINYNVIIRN